MKKDMRNPVEKLVQNKDMHNGMGIRFLFQNTNDAIRYLYKQIKRLEARLAAKQ